MKQNIKILLLILSIFLLVSNASQALDTSETITIEETVPIIFYQGTCESHRSQCLNACWEDLLDQGYRLGRCRLRSLSYDIGPTFPGPFNSNVCEVSCTCTFICKTTVSNPHNYNH